MNGVNDSSVVPKGEGGGRGPHFAFSEVEMVWTHFLEKFLGGIRHDLQDWGKWGSLEGNSGFWAY